MLTKGRLVSESCLEYLNIELVHSYARQAHIPPAAAIEAIGARPQLRRRCCTPHVQRLWAWMHCCQEDAGRRSSGCGLHSTALSFQTKHKGILSEPALCQATGWAGS